MKKPPQVEEFQVFQFLFAQRRPTKDNQRAAAATAPLRSSNTSSNQRNVDKTSQKVDRAHKNSTQHSLLVDYAEEDELNSSDWRKSKQKKPWNWLREANTVMEKCFSN